MAFRCGLLVGDTHTHSGRTPSRHPPFRRGSIGRKRPNAIVFHQPTNKHERRITPKQNPSSLSLIIMLPALLAVVAISWTPNTVLLPSAQPVAAVHRHLTPLALLRVAPTARGSAGGDAKQRQDWSYATPTTNRAPAAVPRCKSCNCKGCDCSLLPPPATARAVLRRL